MVPREAFLDAVCQEKVEDFLAFIKQHKDAGGVFDLEEVLQELSKAQREALWSKLESLLCGALSRVPPERWNTGLDEEENDMEVEVPADLLDTMAILEGVTLVVTASVAVIQDGDEYKSLLECANILNDILPSLPASQVFLLLTIHHLCEAWWTKGLLGKEELGLTAFLACLEQSLMTKKPGAEIRRMWALHEVLLSVDFLHQDNMALLDTLQQCFLSTQHIRNDDWKRLCVFLFSCSINFIPKIHETIKNQLQHFTKAQTEHIAEIYFKAWKKASGEFLEEIENTCIQDFMDFAILLDRSSPVHSKIRQILSYFHQRKSHQNLDTMLYRLYRPILWPALNAPNSEVRANATALFTEAFPIIDHSMGKEKIEQTIQKQLDTLAHLLEDPNPRVRCIVAVGVGKILAKCWDFIPPTIISDFLKKLMEMSLDTSTPDVRCAVYQSLTRVMDNNFSHPLLEHLLPTMKNGIHDTSEKVRVVFLDMLLKIKAVRAAKFWRVISMEHLLARLAVDSLPVSKRIVDLVFKSFFPVNDPSTVWLERCVTLIQMNPMAARKFYQLSIEYTSPTNIAKLMLNIRRCLNGCIKNDSETKENSNSNASVLDDVLSVKDVKTMASLLEVVTILWSSIQKSLSSDAFQYTTAKFAETLPMYFRVFQDERCTTALILLASLLPPASIPTFSVGVLSRLKKLEPGVPQSKYKQLMECVCNWGMARDTLEFITDWLTEAMPASADRGATASRRVRIQDTAEAKPELGLDYLEFLLCRTSTRNTLLPLTQEMKQLHTALGAWRSVLYSHLSSAETEALSAETALRALNLHGRLSIHLQHQLPEGRDFLVSLEKMAAWLEEKVLPYLVGPSGEGDAEAGRMDKRLGLARQAVEGFLTVCLNVVRVGVADQELMKHILHLCSRVLLSEKGYLCVPVLLTVLNEVTENCIYQNAAGREKQDAGQGATQTPEILDAVGNIFHQLMLLLHRLVKKDPEGQECQAAMPALGAFLQTVVTLGGDLSRSVISTICAAMIVESRQKLEKISHPQEVTTPESVQDLPALSSILLSVVLGSPAVTRAYLVELQSCVDSGDIDCLAGIVAVVYFLTVINKLGKFRAECRSASQSAERHLQTHHSVTAEDSEHIQRVIYESAVNTVNDILT